MAFFWLIMVVAYSGFRGFLWFLSVFIPVFLENVYFLGVFGLWWCGFEGLFVH
jgi:hypothetical protein